MELMLSRGGSVKRKATRKTVCPLNRIEQRPSSVRKRIGGSRGRLLISGSDRRYLSLEELPPDGVAEGASSARLGGGPSHKKRTVLAVPDASLR